MSATQTRPDPQRTFADPAPEEVIQQVAARMRERNFDVLIVDDGAAARDAVQALVPRGAEIHSAKSKSLQDSGIFDLLHDPTAYNALRHRYLTMDRQTQAGEIRKLLGAPDYMLGSVHAITASGALVVASASASQIGPYANTAGKVILVVGSQKIVPDLETALARIYEHALPWESAQVRRVANMDSFVGKVLIIEREWVAQRITVVLVRQPLGI